MPPISRLFENIALECSLIISAQVTIKSVLKKKKKNMRT